MEIQKNIVLASFTSWNIGGPAEYFCQPRDLPEIQAALKFAKNNSLSLHVLGGGSNVLIADEGLPGLVICMRKFKGMELTEDAKEFRIEALAGTPKVQLLKSFLSKSLEPALFLAGIPGDVGGGVVMNAGVSESIKPKEFCEIVEWVEVLREGGIVRIPSANIRWSYRHSEGWQPGIIVKVGFVWPLKTVQDIGDQVKRYNQNRLAKQPLEWPSGGSVFVNPKGSSAGLVIDQCGLKGYQIGGAQISTKHANFIINLGGASASDVLGVIEHIQKVVLEKMKIQLNTEVVFLGD